MAEKPTYEELEKRIQELEQTEKALRDSEKRFSTIFHSNPAAIAMTRLSDNRLVDVNDAWQKLMGYTHAEVIDQTPSELNLYAEPAQRERLLEMLYKQGMARDEVKVRRKSGEISDVIISAAIIELAGERYLLSMCQDITERKRAEDALKESETKFRTVAERSPNMIFINRGGRVVYQNKQSEKIMGFKSEEICSPDFNFLTLLAPESLELAKSSFQRHAEGGEIEPLEYTLVRKDGKRINAVINTKLIDYESESAILGVVTDITERKQAEEAQQKTLALLQSAEDVGMSGCWSQDIQTGKEEWSQGEYRLHGLSPDVSPSYELHMQCVHPKDKERHTALFKEHLASDKMKFSQEYKILTRDGTIRHIQANYQITRDDDGRPLSAFGTDKDITERKNMEDRLRQAHKMEAIGTLAGGIAHEFNNILGIIIGNTELALMDVPDWNPAKECLKETRKASLRAKDVVRQIMSFARKTPLERKPIQISTIIKESLKLMRSTIPTIIEIRQTISCESEMILAQPTEIGQVFMNLCANSAHAIGERAGVLEVGLKAINLDDEAAAQYEDLKSGDFVKLTVMDTGHGIKPEIIDRILEPYFTTKDVNEGLGMGLAVVYGIVKKHDGAIKISSEIGKGTVAEVLFPLIKETVESEFKEESAGLRGGTERILFIDDEESLVKMVAQMLERVGYEVVTKMNPMEALALFKAEPDRFDLVITDMAMPHLTGDCLSQELMKIRKDIPVILCTGHSVRIDEDSAKELGLAAYVMKPLVMRDFANTVRKVLDTAKE